MISSAGFIISLALFIKASSIYSEFSKFALPENFSAKFNFIMVYNPLSCLELMFCIYLIWQSHYDDGKNINFSQTITLIIAFLAFIFGIVSYS